MKKSIAILLALSLFTQQGWGALKITGDSTPADISRMAMGTRQIAMGRVGAALGDDAGGFCLNPAGLAGIRSPELNTMMTKLLGEFNYYYLGYVQPTKTDTFGISVLHENPGSIPRVESLDANGYPVDSGESIPVGTTLLNVSYGRKWMPDLYWGFTVKQYMQYLDNAHASGTAADLGIIYGTPIQNLNLGIVAVNAIQSGIIWDTSDSVMTSFPEYLRVGLAWEGLNKKLTFAIDNDIGRFNRTHLGMEYWVINNLALRAGLFQDVMTLGLGLRYDYFELDYAYAYEQAPAEHTAYVSITFGDARISEIEKPEIYIMEE